MHAWGLRLRSACNALAFVSRVAVLPSGLPDTVGIPSLHVPLPNASSAALQPPSHGSRSGRFATPFLYDSFIHYFTPVYPDAIQVNNLPHSGGEVHLMGLWLIFLILSACAGLRCGIVWAFRLCASTARKTGSLRTGIWKE